MMRACLVVALSVAFFLVAVCGGADGREKKPSSNPAVDYYPLQVGNQWTYNLTANGNQSTMITRIAKIETIDQQKLARLDAEVNGSVVATEHLQVTDKGVLRFRTNGIEATPPLVLIKYPVKNGDKWTGAFTAGDSKATYAAEATEEVIEVPAGKFKTMRVAIKLDEQGKVVNTTYWFAKDIGFVKQTVEAGSLNIVIELQKFDKKK